MFRVFCLFFFIFLAPSANFSAQSTPKMVFNLKGLQPGVAKLVGMYGDQNYLADSVIFTTPNQFTYTRKDTLPAGFYTWLLPGTKNFSILLDSDQEFTLTADLADMATSAVFEGSVCNQLFYESTRIQIDVEVRNRLVSDSLRKVAPSSPAYQDLMNKQNALMAERKTRNEALYKANPESFFTKFKIAGQNPDPRELKKADGSIDTLGRLIDYRKRFWEGVDFTDERLLRTPVIGNKLKRYIKELTPQHPDSIIAVSDPLIRSVMQYKPYFQFFVNWIGLAHENTKTNVMDGEAVYVHIIKQFITRELATWTDPKDIDALQKKASEMEASLMGRKGPDVVAPDLSGQMRSIYEKKAQLVVVFMFSPDCEHCKEQAPQIEKIYRDWAGKGVDFYGIAVNTTDAEWRKFLGEQKFSFTNVFDPTNRAIYGKYYVDITPELYVLDQNRTIVAKNLQANQLESIFTRYLK
jgi:thiol-disulfide isomerase/thioredoxin